jgi:hypothetical protein
MIARRRTLHWAVRLDCSPKDAEILLLTPQEILSLTLSEGGPALFLGSRYPLSGFCTQNSPFASGSGRTTGDRPASTSFGRSFTSLSH